MIDYILEIDFVGEDRKKYYHDIVAIEFYTDTIRVEDADRIIMHIPRKNIKNLRIHPVDTRRTEE